MRLYAPSPVSEILDRLLDDPAVARAVVAHRIVPAAPARFAEVPPVGRPADRRRACDVRTGAAVDAPGGSGAGPARRQGHRGRDAHGLGQDPLLQPPGPAVRRRGPGRPRPLPVPHQGPRAGPGGRVPRARLRVGAGHRLRHLRRRHARACPLDRAVGRAGRGDQPGHAARGDPAAPHQVVPAVRAAALRRRRRAAHVPRRLRKPRRERAAQAAADLRALRQPSRHRLLLGHHRQPGGARRPAHGTRPAVHRRQRGTIRRAPRAGARSAAARPGAGRARQLVRARGAGGARLPAGRPPDHRVRPIARRAWSCC